jgi:ABC-type transport system substrate-binding protein
MWLAESAQPNADATEWTIVFRKGIKWSDGTAFTAADPAWCMETLKAVDGLNRAGTYKKELEKAEAVDDVTLKVTLNQQAVVDIGWGGAGLVANSPFPGFPALNEYMTGIKDVTDQYNVLEFSLDKSAQLMTEAGFTKNADGWWADAEGNVVDGDLYAGVPLFGDIAPIVAEQLRAAGFKSEHKAPPDVWAAKVDGRASMFLFGHGGATKDPWDTFNLYYSEPLPMGEQDWSNITRWQNAEFKAITDEMNNTAMDDPKMKDLFKQGMQIWYTELPDCPLVQWFHRIPVNNWYFNNWPDEANPVMNSALWHLTMLQVVLQLKATGNA